MDKHRGRTVESSIVRPFRAHKRKHVSRRIPLWGNQPHDHDGDQGWAPADGEVMEGGEEGFEAMGTVEELSQKMSEIDAVMEANVSDVLNGWLQLQQDPVQAVELLGNSYRGLAQMANLLADWMQSTGTDLTEVQKSMEEFITALILDNFDPVEVDQYFQDDTQLPEWLEPMIHVPAWRAVLCKLSESHPDSLMLKYAIQKISDAGYQTEIASVSTASTDIEVFNRVLRGFLQNLLDKTEEELGSAMADFTKMVCYRGSAYIFTQVLLHGLMKHPNGYRLKRISQDIAAHAKAEGKNILHLSLLLSNATSYPEVAGCLHSLLSSSRASPADINMLYNKFSASQPPPIELIRIPELFEMLIVALFDPNGKKENAESKKKYIWVLAYIASVRQTSVQVDKSDLEPTIKALSAVSAVCDRNALTYKTAKDLSVIITNLEYPVVAMGLLFWIEQTTQETDYFANHAALGQVPIHLALLDLIVERHVMTHARTFQLLKKCLDGDLGLVDLVAVDMKRQIMDRLVHLMSQGYVVEVLSYFAQSALNHTMDHALIRDFVTEVLKMIEPEFSVEMVRGMLHIINAVKHALSKIAPQVVEFLRACEEEENINGGETLSKKEMALVESLRIKFVEEDKGVQEKE